MDETDEMKQIAAGLIEKILSNKGRTDLPEILAEALRSAGCESSALRVLNLLRQNLS